LKKWELPKMLNEISGIAWIGDNKVACVQDEDGIIFIYNLATNNIEKIIAFGSGGDFEGITVIKENAYVLRSDGVIFEISNYEGENIKVQKYETAMMNLKGINLEGLGADPANNRLLLAVKERKEMNDQKEIYAFDLDKKNTGIDPFFHIDLRDPILKNVSGGAKNKFMPGEIAIHPGTGEIYILDGSNPKILIADKNGSLQKLVMLRARDFQNPEGLTFDPNGDLYISNEAGDQPANILRVSLLK